MDPLKLIALDHDDIAVVSTHLQDAVVKVADIVWLPAERRPVPRCGWRSSASSASWPTSGRRGTPRPAPCTRSIPSARRVDGLFAARHAAVAGEPPAGTAQCRSASTPARLTLPGNFAPSLT